MKQHSANKLYLWCLAVVLTEMKTLSRLEVWKGAGLGAGTGEDHAVVASSRQHSGSSMLYCVLFCTPQSGVTSHPAG